MTDHPKHILAIPGSTRTHSTHLNLIAAIGRLSSGIFDIVVSPPIAGLPHFNPDLDNDTPSYPVSFFRKQLREADGVLICTPEYAMGVPGTLKNALDWTVSSAELYRKPTALITASSQGYKGHAALMETLKIIGCTFTDETQLIIPFIKTKVSADGTITDTETLLKVKELISAFHREYLNKP